MSNSANPIFDWNTKIAETADVCVHELIEQQIIDNPDHEALCSTTESLTYRELDQCSTLIAKRLLVLGARRNTFIALAFEHSIWNVVAILAVWKAGAAFAPLPPSPASRVGTILDQLESTIILCSRSRAPTVMQHHCMTMTVDDRIKEQALAITSSDSATTHGYVVPSDVAYAIFTSGSTGTPKVNYNEMLILLGTNLALTPYIGCSS
jgi:non-ribosomal peptide synthetase component F